MWDYVQNGILYFYCLCNIAELAILWLVIVTEGKQFLLYIWVLHFCIQLLYNCNFLYCFNFIWTIEAAKAFKIIMKDILSVIVPAYNEEKPSHHFDELLANETCRG